MSMKLLKAIIAGSFAAIAGGIQAAEWLGTGSDSLWGNTNNWDSSTGVPTGNIAFSSTAGDNKTATLDGDHSFDGTFAISAGTAEAPFVFTATDEAVAVSNSLNQTSTKGFALTGALKVEKGIWNFANDIVPNGGYLHLTGGRLTTKYWMPVKGNSTIVVDDGELVMGYRDNGEQNNGRLNLAESADGVVTLTQNGGRIRCSNNTNGGNDTEAFTVGSQARTTTTVNLNGGEMVVNGKTHIGYGATTKAELNVNGGVLTTTHDILVGRNGDGVMTITEGAVTCGSSSTVRYVCLGNASSTTAGGTINLNGGVLSAGSVRNGSGTAASVLNLNGGMLKPYISRASESDAFIPASEYLTVNVGAGGAIIDTDKYRTLISHDLVSGVGEGEADGGLVKKGLSTLLITGKTTYTGATVVERGVLALNAGHEFTGALTIGAQGAVTVDVTGAIDAETVAVGDTIQIVKASAVNLASGDTLATSVFLTGPVVGYTLSMAEGWIVATVTDVTNVASTRKVTSFIAGDAADTNTDGTRHVDQDVSFDNGQPANNSYDVVVFPGDALMCIYMSDKNVCNNRTFGDFVIRGGVVKVRSSNRWPNLGVKHVCGNGVISLRQVGLQSASGVPMVVDETVTVEFSCNGISATQDTWAKGDGGAMTTVNGPVVVTNGILCVYENVVFNGPVTIGAYSTPSYLSGDTTINGTWTVGNGADFNFKSKAVTAGAEAVLVLQGTGKVSGLNAVFPKVVVGESCSMSLASLPACGDGGYVLDGGALTMGYAALQDSGTNLLVKAGSTLTLDMSGLVDASEGTVASIPNVSLAEGVSAGDITILTSGSLLAWNVTLSEDGTIQLTAKAPDGPNRWVGPAEGYWKDAANWQYGVPAADGIAQFDSDVLCWIDANKTVSNIVVSAGATVLFKRSTGNPTLYVKEVSGAGKIQFYHTGFEANGLPGTVAETLTLEYLSTESDGADSWMKGGSAELEIYAPITGAGYLRVYGGVRFYGDNSGFTGYLRKDDFDARFMTAASGFPNATKVGVYGTLWLWFTEGDFALGGDVTMTSSGNRGINMPSGVATGTGVSLTLGGGDGNVSMGVDKNNKTYQAYTQNGNGWTEGCDRFTIKKIGAGSFANNMTARYNMVCEGGITTFKQSDALAPVAVKTGATISAEADVTLGATTFEPGAKVELNDASPVTVTGDVDVSGVEVVLSDALKTELAAKDAQTIDPSRYTVLAATGTVSGAPAESGLNVGTAKKPNWMWVARVRNNVLEYVRKAVNRGFMVIIQ